MGLEHSLILTKDAGALLELLPKIAGTISVSAGTGTQGAAGQPGSLAAQQQSAQQ